MHNAEVALESLRKIPNATKKVKNRRQTVAERILALSFLVYRIICDEHFFAKFNSILRKLDQLKKF